MSVPHLNSEWPPEGFETEEDAIAEDRHRMDSARRLLCLIGPPTAENLAARRRLRLRYPDSHHLPWPRTTPFAIKRLISMLQTSLETGQPPESLASMQGMRARRERMFTTLFGILQRGDLLELATFTILNKHWIVTSDQLQNIDPIAIKRQFITHLNRAGVMAIPGVLVAFIEAEFEPASGNFTIHIHGWTTAEKASALRNLKPRWGYVPTPTGADAIKVQPLNDVARQLTYVMKSFWGQRTFRASTGKRDRKVHRIDEPFHTRYLLWLDAQRWSDMVIHTGGWSRPYGGTPAMRELYFSIFKGESKAVSSGAPKCSMS